MAGALLLPGDEFCQLKGGELDERERVAVQGLGVVTVGGQQGLGTCSPASGSPCKYCGEVAGHTGQCPVVS